MSTLLSQGGYGCVYYPGIKCSGAVETNDMVVTKLQRKDFNANNEMNIGKIISSIKDYKKYFVPVIKSCDINLRQLDSNAISDCKIVNEYDSSKYLLMTLEYIKNASLKDTLRKGITTQEKKKTFIQILNMYKYLMHSISILIEHHIVHLDIKPDNLLYSLKDMSPLIIDFGIAIPMKNLDEKNKWDYFYAYIPEYYIWPLEVHVINYYRHRISGNLSKDDIEIIANDFCTSNSSLLFFSPEFYDRYRNSCLFYLKQFIGIDRDTVINKLIGYWKTWDCFAANTMFIDVFRKVFQKYVHNNKMFVSLMELLVTNISPNPEKRLTPDECIKQFNKCFFLEEDTNNYINLISDLR
tara:strand:+ start:4147 stop:5205 length:1059 start_codon:yes stop_codon:yes gene_type:complete